MGPLTSYDRSQTLVPLSHNPTSSAHPVVRATAGQRPDADIQKYLDQGGNKWMACIVRPDQPIRMPVPDGGYGTALVTQQLWLELTTNADVAGPPFVAGGDFRFIVMPFPRFLVTTVAPGTGVHTAVPCPDVSVITTKFQRLRPLHHSVLTTYYGDRDTTGGIITTQVGIVDSAIATWNDDADALARRLNSHSSKLVDGAYAYGVNDPLPAAHFNNLLLTATTTAFAGVSTSAYSYIKQSISSASVNKTVGRIEVVASWEGYSEDQLWPIYREANEIHEYWDAFTIMDKINMPRIFTNDEHDELIKLFLSAAMSLVKPVASTVGTLLLRGQNPLSRGHMSPYNILAASGLNTNRLVRNSGVLRPGTKRYNPY